MPWLRLCEPGSDLHCRKWLAGVYGEGFADLQLQHFYRTCYLLHDVRAELETQLFARERNLFDNGLELLFVDSTARKLCGKDKRGDEAGTA